MDSQKIFSFCGVAAKYLSSSPLFERNVVDEVFSFVFYDRASAIETENVRALKYLKSRGCVFGEDCVFFAIRANSLRVLQYFLVDLGMRISDSDIMVAVETGIKFDDFAIISFIIDNGLVDLRAKSFDMALISSVYGEVPFFALLHANYAVRFESYQVEMFIRNCGANTYFLRYLSNIYPEVSIFPALDLAIKTGNTGTVELVISKCQNKDLFKRSLIKTVLMSDSSTELLDIFFSYKLFDCDEVIHEIIEFDYDDDLSYVLKKFPWIETEEVFLHAIAEESRSCMETMIRMSFQNLYFREIIWKQMDENLSTDDWEECIDLFVRKYLRPLTRFELTLFETEEETAMKRSKFIEFLIERDFDQHIKRINDIGLIEDKDWAISRAIEYEAVNVFAFFIGRDARKDVLEEIIMKDLDEFVEVYMEGRGIDLFSEEEISLLIPKYRHLLSYFGYRS